MRKRLLIITACLFFVACKKEYTCTCTSSWANKEYDETIKAKSRQQAKQECESRNSPWVDGPYNCHLR